MANKKCPSGKVWENSRCVRKKSHLVRNFAVLGGIWGISPLVYGLLTQTNSPRVLILPALLGVYMASLITCSHPNSLGYILTSGLSANRTACIGGCCDNIGGFLLSIPLSLIIGVLLGALVGYIIKKVKYG